MVEKAKAEPHIWYPLGGRWKQQAVRSKGTYRRVKYLTIGSQADPDRKVLRACIILPDTMAMWMTDSPMELRGIISKLQEVYDQMVGVGQSKIASLIESKTESED